MMKTNLSIKPRQNFTHHFIHIKIRMKVINCNNSLFFTDIYIGKANKVNIFEKLRKYYNENNRNL